MDLTSLKEPVSYVDYYTKASIAKYILDKSGSTLTKMEKEGKIFSPRFKRNPYSYSNNPRRYYSMADAMRICIMTYGSIEMERIYKLGLFGISGQEDPDIHIFLTSNSGTMATLKRDIRASLYIVKNQIVSKSIVPVDLSPFLVEENVINEFQH